MDRIISFDDKPRLIPGLPDEISQQILARIPRIWYLNLKAVSRRWKAAVTSPEIYKVRKELGTTEEWLYILMHQRRGGLSLHALDPLERKGGVCNGCAIAAVDGCLHMLGGVSRFSSMTRVWKYDPVSNCWSKANPMSVGRAYFETAVLNNKLFVVGGSNFGRVDVGHESRFSRTPLQSAEVFDPETGLWSDIPSMPWSKAHAAVNLGGSHNPVITGLASYRGKLYVSQSFYGWPVFADGGGEAYVNALR